ncbi:MAG: aspartate carbamoyltransferase regulatory subunit [Promethearchaeia archaeon]|nr:MAG: aspartate carbamoyltransferase regulatory subunit [Candidatus Lokiarchaeia archaeon]
MNSENSDKDGKRLYVEKIQRGTVIDHIKEGFAFSVMKILGLEGKDGSLITVGINVKSNSSQSGKKDIVKVEKIMLDQKQIHQIAIISPRCKVSFIEDYKVVKKFVVKIPDMIHGIVKCPNEKCITNVEREPVETKFRVISEDPLKIACTYCERIVYQDEILRTSF